MPAESTAQRKLAAIMFTDMVGHTELTQRNERIALELLEEHRRLLREQFPKFQGREIETTGDGFLVEFASALEAAKCAIEVQRALATRNISVPPERHIQIRIGIHVGDVMHKDGHVLGDGVNIAARLQPLAEPGGICISVDVERQIRNTIEASLVKLGPTELKNIHVPMELFRIVLPWEKGTFSRQTRPKRKSRPFLPIVCVVSVVLLGAAGWFVFVKPSGSKGTLSRSSKTFGGRAAITNHIQSIAVLPLDNYSGSPDQEFFADGMTEELISTLAKIGGLERVISRSSVMVYKGKHDKKIPEIARELNVDAIVEGSVRREGDNVRITIQLIEGATDKHLWTDSYNREMRDVLKLQSDLARGIAREINVTLTSSERGRLANARQVDFAAYELYLKGRQWWNERTKEGFEKGIEYFQQALARDPNYAPAYAGIADCHLLLADYGHVRVREALPKTREAAEKALALDDQSAEAHTSLGFLLRYEHKWEEAEDEFHRALALNPNYATAHHWHGDSLSAQGRHAEAIAELKRALELDPLSLIINKDLGSALFFARQYDEAIEQLQKTLKMNPTFVHVYGPLAGSYAAKGMYDKAIALVHQRYAVDADDFASAVSLCYNYARSGKHSEAKEMFERLKTNSTNELTPSTLAFIYAAFRDKDMAIASLTKAYAEREAGLDGALHGDPVFDFLRSDERFIALLKAIGLEK